MNNLKAKFEKLTAHFSPKIIGEVNDVYIKIVKILGDEVPWHIHKNEDELFYIVEGELLFEIEGLTSFTMTKGDIFIVQKGINHRISSKKECKIMLIEPKSTLHTGNKNVDITKTLNQQFL